MVLAVRNVNIGRSFIVEDVLPQEAILSMDRVSWLPVPAKKRWTFVESVRISAVKCFTVILMMTRREMIRKGQGSNAAVR